MLLDYPVLGKKMLASRQDYRNAVPFPHVVLDDFLRPPVVAALLPHFPPAVVRAGQQDRSADTDSGKPAQFRKRWVSREAGVGIALRRLYWELNAGPFIGLLEKMCGIENLLPDPYLRGGGAHQTLPGGFLRVHCDFNRQPELNLDRRLNLLIYFNREWRAQWGGNLELWSADMTRKVQSIEPIAGRCVVFSAASTSFHGHPQPLSCPAGYTRKSVALYYYSNGRPRGAGDAPHGTLWQDLPGDE